MAMVLDEIKDAVQDVDNSRQQYKDALGIRNSLMIELKAAGVPERVIMKLTGLSRDSVARITQGAKNAAALEVEMSLSER